MTIPLTRWRPWAAMVGWLALAPAQGLSAQVLKVAVLTQGPEARPIPGALVTVRQGQGGVPDRRLADDGGVALFRLAPGSYSARIDAIGHRGVVVVVEVPGVGTKLLEVGLVPEPFALPSVDVRGTLPALCRASAREAQFASRLWEAARKTLESVELARTSAPPLLTVTQYAADLDRQSVLIRVDSQVTRGRTPRPFASLAPDTLRREGYVVERPDGVWYNGPDADLLLGDEFLAGHCFGVDTSRYSSGTVGLTFTPVPSQNRPDIAGTLSLERATGALRGINFRYVGVPLPAGMPSASGQVGYSNLGDGRWIVSDWTIVAPRIRRLLKGLPALTDNSPRQPMPVDTLIGYRRTGGRAALLIPAGEPNVRGRVTSAAGTPLSAATVRITQTGRVAQTNDEGWFVWPGSEAGQWDIVVQAIGFQRAGFRVSLAAGRLTPASFPLDPVIQQLDSITVSGTQALGGLAEFERRRQRGVGRFFTLDDVVASGAQRVSSLLRMLPAGVQVRDSAGTPLAVSSRGSKLVTKDGQFYVVPCVLRTAIDGQIQPWGTSLDVLDPTEIAGIEVYLGASTMPAEFSAGRVDQLCGLLVFWTRR